MGDEAAGLVQGLDPDDPSLATSMGYMCMKVASGLRDFWWGVCLRGETCGYHVWGVSV